MDRITRFVESTVEVGTASATGSGVFTDDSVGRDNHRLITSGIEYDDFLSAAGPMLWCHCDTEPPVAQATRITLGDKQGRVAFKFVPRETLPLAGVVADLIRDGYLRGLSASWRPLEWKYSQDHDRPGGMDFFRSDLLEISFVPIPALPSALVDAQARGIRLKPLASWAERALDTNSFRGVGRPEVEAIYRACSGRKFHSPARSPFERQDRARRIAARVAAEDAAACDEVRARLLERP